VWEVFPLVPAHRKTVAFHHPLCVDTLLCTAGNGYKSGKAKGLLNLYWWKKKRILYTGYESEL
jgi:hypothetical protein